MEPEHKPDFQYGSYPNKLRRKLQAGEIAWGTIIWDLPCAATAEALATAGLDWVWIDTEHRPTGLETITAFLRTAQPLGLPTLVRVPDADYHMITRALDCGASGIIVPRVSNRATVEKVVAASHYPPDGCRGVGLHTMNCSDSALSLAQRLERLNREIIVVIQIETAEALENMEDIVSAPGIDAVLIGPTDLSVSLGVAGQYEHPRILQTQQQLIELSKKYGFIVGYHVDMPEMALRAAQRGATMVSVACDVYFLAAGCKDTLQQLNAGCPSNSVIQKGKA